MPSAPTTRTRVPERSGAGAARRPVLAADVDAAGAERRVDVMRDDPLVPTSASVRDGTPGAAPMRAIIRGRSSAHDTPSTTMNATI